MLARQLEMPPVSLAVPQKRGRLRAKQSIARLFPSTLHLLALKPSEQGTAIVLRVIETSGKPSPGRFVLNGVRVNLGIVPAGAIATWRLVRSGGRLHARRVSIDENAKVANV